MENKISKSLTDYPWPQKGDRLFPGQVHSCPNSENSHQHIPSLAEHIICEGYYRAGEILAERLIDQEHDLCLWQGIIYPMLFCYRHYLELVLKEIIPILVKLDEQKVDDDFLFHEHGLMRLWNEFCKHACKVFPEFSEQKESPDKVAERCINEFNQVDKRSQAFRYVMDKQGSPTVDNLPLINVEQLKQTMASLRSYFDGCDIYAGKQLEIQRDINEMSGE